MSGRAAVLWLRVRRVDERRGGAGIEGDLKRRSAASARDDTAEGANPRAERRVSGSIGLRSRAVRPRYAPGRPSPWLVRRCDWPAGRRLVVVRAVALCDLSRMKSSFLFSIYVPQILPLWAY